MIALAGCVIRNQAGHILLLHRQTEKLTQWELPGGKVEVGESTSDAAVRETLEETGLTVSVVKQLGSTEFGQGDRQFKYDWFEAEIVSGEPKVMEPDVHDQIEYVDLAKADPSTLSPNLINFIKEMT